MLFNSYEFLFGFLPVTLAGFFLLGRRSRHLAAAWLAVASLFFYGWWSIRAVPLLLFSICANYLLSRKLSPVDGKAADGANNGVRKLYLIGCVSFNLAVLAFFKYANFFISNLNTALGAIHQSTVSTVNVVLPIGISFYTFTQIAFIVDSWQGKVKERNLVHYLLFVTYFPHLIAGPVLHHSQMMPQFANKQTYRPNYRVVAVGVLIFTIGLAKKVLMADPLGGYASILFNRVDAGTAPDFISSWLGVLAYTFQIYFDFSGYSDMAIGLSLFFGIQLPLNFNSPYKARNIVDFWRRWHISLSTFLRDYLYIPLGGNRLGKVRRYANLFLTMLLGGLWHGASWTFVLWGAAHGTFLIINHAWQRIVGADHKYGPVGEAICWLLTFLSVCLAWVLFRAESARTAIRIYKGLLGLNGLETFQGAREQLLFIAAAALICIFASNAAEIRAVMDRRPVGERVSSLVAGVVVGVMLFACLVFMKERSQFIYFNF